MRPEHVFRPDPWRPRTWPLTLKVPLQAALLTFLVAVVSTQAALLLARDREEAAVEASLAALAGAMASAVAALAPADPDAAARLLAALPAGEGDLLAAVAIAHEDGSGRPVRLGPPPDEAATPGRLTVSRTVATPDGGPVTVTVAADAAMLAAGRWSDQVRIAVFDLVIALAGALVALWFVRVTLAPVARLTARLVAERIGEATPAAALEPVSTEFGRLQRVMNERVAAEEERAEALYRLAERERDTGLAKLAASIAHEVRNPLAGLMNAVSTLRRFGDDPAVRAESLDLIERGLSSIDRVAGAALSTYRPARGGRGFGPNDLADLRVLTGPDAARRGVTLDWSVSLSGPVDVDADALRQAILNLLLNAVKASGDGGRVALAAALAGEALVVSVSDTGPGLPGDVRRFLSGLPDEPFPRPDALGLWTVVRLLDDLDGRLSVDTHPRRGTTVTVRVPVRHGPVATRAPDADGRAA